MKYPSSIRAALPVLAAGLAPTLLALALTASCHARRGAGQVELQPIRAGSAKQLVKILNNYGYSWPPGEKVPALALQHFPHGLDHLQPEARKHAFLRALLPMVLAVNAHIRRERREILSLLETAADGHWPMRLQKLAARYDITDTTGSANARELLLRRCDTVPPGLVLAQAAKESGWGTSRFALQGNNLFGVHTWVTDAGLAATGAAPSANNQVRIYPTLMDSVEDYISNLNIGHAYVAFRKLRAREHSNGSLSSVALAETLDNYSELGKLYTRRLQALIRQNHLQELTGLALVPPSRQAGDGDGDPAS